jgi:hypothetical protein
MDISKEQKMKTLPLLAGFSLKSDEGNTVCILKLDNLLDYSIYGYNITKDQVKEVKGRLCS